MSITVELSIRNVTSEVEVTLTGDYDAPTVECISLCDGCIDLDIPTIMLLMGHQEWNDFVDEVVNKRNEMPVEAMVGFGRSMNGGE
jgi:hypothetical protein